MTTSSTSLAMLTFARFGGRSGTDVVLLLIGLAFAGLMVWAIERSGKSTT